MLHFVKKYKLWRRRRIVQEISEAPHTEVTNDDSRGGNTDGSSKRKDNEEICKISKWMRRMMQSYNNIRGEVLTESSTWLYSVHETIREFKIYDVACSRRAFETKKFVMQDNDCAEYFVIPGLFSRGLSSTQR
jgi:hypothetical protein